LRRVLFYAFDSDPRIEKKKDPDSSDDEDFVYNESKSTVTWPPEIIIPGKILPFAFLEVPANKHYVEQKLSQNVRGRFIMAHCLDGWEKHKTGGLATVLKSLGKLAESHEKISIEFIGFVGPADPEVILRDVGTKFGIHH